VEHQRVVQLVLVTVEEVVEVGVIPMVLVFQKMTQAKDIKV
jgi:hypothetical protein